jgi:hypothetical protein
MRDRRFIASHRGGPLAAAQHRLLAVWAAACAEHVLPLFEQHHLDNRPKHAIAIARAWARGAVPVGDAQKAAVASHAAARAADNKSAIAVARATGHAVATAHMADHSLGAALYALKAIATAGQSIETERAWQIQQLPQAVRELVLSALDSDRFKSRRPKSFSTATSTSRKKQVAQSPRRRR